MFHFCLLVAGDSGGSSAGAAGWGYGVSVYSLGAQG